MACIQIQLRSYSCIHIYIYIYFQAIPSTSMNVSPNITIQQVSVGSNVPRLLLSAAVLPAILSESQGSRSHPIEGLRKTIPPYQKNTSTHSKNTSTQSAFLRGILENTSRYDYLEDHPRTCKWLGSPPFIKHKKAIRKGFHNPIWGTYDHHDYHNHLLTGMILQVSHCIILR